MWGWAADLDTHALAGNANRVCCAHRRLTAPHLAQGRRMALGLGVAGHMSGHPPRLGRGNRPPRSMRTDSTAIGSLCKATAGGWAAAPSNPPACGDARLLRVGGGLAGFGSGGEGVPNHL